MSVILLDLACSLLLPSLVVSFLKFLMLFDAILEQEEPDEEDVDEEEGDDEVIEVLFLSDKA